MKNKRFVISVLVRGFSLALAWCILAQMYAIGMVGYVVISLLAITWGAATSAVSEDNQEKQKGDDIHER